VLNVGAGTGSYEPSDRRVVAVEPSRTMIEQRPSDAAVAIRAVAESLPFPDDTFDAALAVLTIHHWTDVELGLGEMQRVARGQVVFMFSHVTANDLWLLADYFPEVRDLETEKPPTPEAVAAMLDATRVETVPVPSDCIDGFGGCFWNRPEAYLDPAVQDGMSSFAQLDPEVRARGTARLRADLTSGAWDARYGGLRTLPEMDLGYRLVVAGVP
jgi:SAM-dependent methyltransferase